MFNIPRYQIVIGCVNQYFIPRTKKVVGSMSKRRVSTERRLGRSRRPGHDAVAVLLLAAFHRDYV